MLLCVRLKPPKIKNNETAVKCIGYSMNNENPPAGRAILCELALIVERRFDPRLVSVFVLVLVYTFANFDLFSPIFFPIRF